MSDRQKSSLPKLVLGLLCLSFIGVGAHMLVKPEKYNFLRMSARQPQALHSQAFKWLGENVGTRPTGGLLAGAGALVLFASVRPKKKE